MPESGFYLLPTNKLYKKEDVKHLKNFPAGYVVSFYRNLTDNIDDTSDFFSRITADADIPKEDVQKFILGTPDYAKIIQTDINHYVTRDRINNATFRQKLDPVSKNILRRQDPLELVFEDISTFDAENPIVGSFLREIDNKRESESDFIKSLPSHPGKEFEIKKRLDKLRGINNSSNNNKNNSNLFTVKGDPPSLPRIEDFLDNSRPPPPPPPIAPSINLDENLFKSEAFPSLAEKFDVNAKIRTAHPNISTKGIGNDLFGSQAASVIREKDKNSTRN